MKKRIMYLLMAGVMTITASGCGCSASDSVSGNTVSGELVPETVEYEYDLPENYGPYSEGAKWGENVEGSAVYLDGTTAVVTIAVTADGEEFAESDLAALKDKTKTAIDFITESAASYGKTADFKFDEEDLNFEYTYTGADIEYFEQEDYDGIVEELKEGSINVDQIRDKYKADGIAYLFLINGQGDAFASPHLYEDGADYFNECAGIFKDAYNDDFDIEPTGPNVIAYELLRLFGAVELRETNADYGYTAALVNAVREKYLDDVMVVYFENDGTIEPDKITKKITDITAYCLGLTDSFEELDANPAFKKDYVAAFVDNYMKNTNNNENTEDYDWEDAWEREEEEDFDSDDEEFEYEVYDEDEDEDDEESEDEDEDDGIIVSQEDDAETEVPAQPEVPVPDAQ